MLNVLSLERSHLSPWRNRFTRSAVNRKVGGSSPPGDVAYVFFFFLTSYQLNSLKFFLKTPKYYESDLISIYFMFK